MKAVEYVLYGIPKGETEQYMEVLLLSDASDTARVEKVKQLAGWEGFHSFRVARIDLMQKPDFTKAVKR